ncbi:MAG: phosphomannomutase/phosphoglucomutase [Candidatus Saccharibacteria bacterium]|nr:phosphomannomutase/phosphoglucomutase [Moraxellaceae bacterium]
MKKSANTTAKTNNMTAKLLSKKLDHRIKPLALHVTLATLVGVGSYLLTQHFVDQQQTQSVDTFGQQAAILIDRRIDNWISQSRLLAQQPTLKSDSQVKAIVGMDGVVPPTLSFAEQDLLNRTHTAPTGAEITNTGNQAQVTTVVEMPAGGYLVSQRPLAPLINDLKQITPENIQLVLSQKIGSGDNIELLALHRGENNSLTNIPLKSLGWQLSIAKSDPTGTFNPMTNLPLLAGLLTFFGCLLAILAWFFAKPQRHLVSSSTRTDPLSNLDAVALELSPSTATQATFSQQPLKPLIVQTPEPTPEPVVDLPPIQDAPQILQTAAPEIDLDDLSYLDEALTTPAPEKSNLMEFTLGSGALLPETEFYLSNELPKHIFRAYDIRGKVTELTAEWMVPIARAIGSELRARGQIEVVVGYDARTTSEQYAKIMRDCLVGCGLQVIDIGMVPTPVMHYATRQLQGNGVMITASHNPAEYNGVKWLMQQQSPLPEDIDAIYNRAKNKVFTDGKGKIRQESFTAHYLDDMLNDVILSEDLNVVIDGMNGVMGEIAQQAIETAGCTVTDLDIKPNGVYPHGNPDPCEPNRLNELSQQMIISQADIGFAFDGDGDRMVAVTKDGTVVTSDQLIALFSIMILESKPGADIVFDVKCSRMVSQTITANGGRPIMSRSGNTFIRHAVMSENNEVAFGGEFSGHYFFNDDRGHASDDGLYAALRLIEWLGQRGQSLDELLKTLPNRVGTADIYVPLDTDLPPNFFADIAADAIFIEGATLTTIDGVRLDFQNGFGIIRASNTGAFATLRFEAESETSLQYIQQVFHDLVKKHLPSLAEKMPKQSVIEHSSTNLNSDPLSLNFE